MDAIGLLKSSSLLVGKLYTKVSWIFHLWNISVTDPGPKDSYQFFPRFESGSEY